MLRDYPTKSVTVRKWAGRDTTTGAPNSPVEVTTVAFEKFATEVVSNAQGIMSVSRTQLWVDLPGIGLRDTIVVDGVDHAIRSIESKAGFDGVDSWILYLE